MMSVLSMSWMPGSEPGMGSERSALIYLDLETPTVRGGNRSAVLVMSKPAAPRSSSSAETMMANADCFRRRRRPR
jgi:hypothetical protein